MSSHLKQPRQTSLTNNDFFRINRTNVHQPIAQNHQSKYFSMANTTKPNIHAATTSSVPSGTQNRNLEATFETNSRNNHANPNQSLEHPSTSKMAKFDDRSNQNFKKTTKERSFSGSVERVIKWHKTYPGFCYFEVIAAVISIQEGNTPLQKVMLLRDKKGPILQVVHYVNDRICIDDFFVGQMLRCIGHMVGPNILHSFSTREATQDEIVALQRLCYVCDHAVARSITNV